MKEVPIKLAANDLLSRLRYFQDTHKFVRPTDLRHDDLDELIRRLLRLHNALYIADSTSGTNQSQPTSRREV